MYKGIGLFSGAGGLDIGAEQAGIDLIYSMDNDPDSVHTLQSNFSSHDIALSDIKDVNFKQFKKVKNLIIFGGPPCQPFSKNGYWVKNINRDSSEDPRNLLSQFLRSIDEAKPDAFVFENVESMTHPSNLNSLNNFKNSINDIGYHYVFYKLNAADFGVPQKRKRIFIIGTRKKIKFSELEQTHFEKTDDLFGSNYQLHEGVGKYIKPFALKKYDESYGDASEGTYYKELVNVLPGKNYMSLAKLNDSSYDGKTFKSGSRFWNFLYKLDPKLPSITIAAQPGPWVGPFHWTNRRLRVPEIAAIQTFPLNYNFYGTRRSIQKQIGNAVPVLLAKTIFNHLLENLSR